MSDKILEDYVKRLIDRQYSMQDRELLTDEELREIALEMGMTDRDYDESLEKAEAHYARGVRYVSDNNYEDAIYELSNTVNIYPNHVDGLYMLAKAYTHFGLLNDGQEELDKADIYVNRALILKPMHEGALKLKSQKRKGEKGHRSAKASQNRMNKIVMFGVVGLTIAIVLITWISIINNINALETGVNTTWADVQNNYQRRAELIPQLQSTVKGAVNFEQETLRQVIEARSKAAAIHIDPANISQVDLDKFIAAQNNLGQSLGRLFAVAEDYPELRAMESFLTLQSQIEGTENRISRARKLFNDAVGTYNTKVGSFPTSIFGYDNKAYFQASPMVTAPPKIDL